MVALPADGYSGPTHMEAVLATFGIAACLRREGGIMGFMNHYAQIACHDHTYSR